MGEGPHCRRVKHAKPQYENIELIEFGADTGASFYLHAVKGRKHVNSQMF